MLTPDDLKELKPKFEEIHRQLNVALIKSGADIPEDAAGHYIASLVLMEELVDEVAEGEGHSVKESLIRAIKPTAEKAGLAGGLTAGTVAALFTGGGGFGVVAGGSMLGATGVGLAGLGGATVATGGTALAGGAALYLVYKGGSMALETEIGQKVVEQAATTGQKSAKQAKVFGKKAADGIGRMRNLRITFENEEG
ncbi:MAG: hypothetical protein OXD31_00090 [Chloroflexi bacterium]|nr:hypothetical protein [Chloroflexota bacterium]